MNTFLRKLLGILLWIGGLGFALLCLGGTGSFSDDAGMTKAILNAIGATILFMVSGIGRRIFHIKKEVVEENGVLPAILSRINCKRLYLSIFMYAALAFPSIVVSDNRLGSSMEDWMAVVSLAVCVIFFFFVRRTCPRCGYKLTYDGAEYGDKAEWSTEGNSRVAKRDYTKRYHCSRCGTARFFVSKKETARF